MAKPSTQPDAPTPTRKVVNGGVLTPDKRKYYLSRWGGLDTEYSSWREHYREINRYLMPRTGEFLTTDRNQGRKKNQNIIDNTATRAHRVLAAGLMSGMTSPARPWFRLASTDKTLMASAGVKTWLNSVTELMRDVFEQSNTYRSLHTLYEELGAYGTAVALVTEDFDNVIHLITLTVGQYRITCDAKGRVNAVWRQFDMTVQQLVDEFGFENCSAAVQSIYNSKTGLDQWFTVIHCVEERKTYDQTQRDTKNMPYASVYFEFASNDGKLLRESGFKSLIALAPRWSTSGQDIYGASPAMDALGDIKALQHAQTNKALGIEYGNKPPLQAPAELKGQQLSTLPGGVTFHSSSQQGAGIRTLFETKLDISGTIEDINDIRQRIRDTFYADLFLMLSNMDNSHELTAREVAERHEEKLLMIGPVLERLNDELLKPLISLTFNYLKAAGALPPAPQEMQGKDLNVQFVSTLAQAQRAVGVSSVDRLVGTVASIGQLQLQAQQPVTALDKLDIDKIIDSYSDMLGNDPDFLHSDDEVAAIRQARAKLQAQQQAMQQAPAMAGAAKDMAQAGAGNPQDLANQFMGYSIPQGAQK